MILLLITILKDINYNMAYSIEKRQQQKYILMDFQIYLNSQTDLASAKANLSDENIDLAINQWLEIENNVTITLEEYFDGLECGIYSTIDGYGYFVKDGIESKTTVSCNPTQDRTIAKIYGFTYINWYSQ